MQKFAQWTRGSRASGRQCAYERVLSGCQLPVLVLECESVSQRIIHVVVIISY